MTDLENLQNYFATRRSVKPEDLTHPGPSKEELATILTLACRTPDHGKLCPWRFIEIGADQRASFANIIIDAAKSHYRDPSQQTLDKEVEKFINTPCIIVMIYAPKSTVKIPQWEQVMATGAAAMNLMHGFHALGFKGQWLTQWYSFHDQVNGALGLKAEEKIAGYFFIGSSNFKPDDRPRPVVKDITSAWLPTGN